MMPSLLIITELFSVETIRNWCFIYAAYIYFLISSRPMHANLGKGLWSFMISSASESSRIIYYQDTNGDELLAYGNDKFVRDVVTNR